MVTPVRFVRSWISQDVRGLGLVLQALSAMRSSTFQHPKIETHRHQQEVWKKSLGVRLGERRHQLENNLPPSDLLHHTIDTGFETHWAVSEGSPFLFGGARAATLASASLAAFATFSHPCFLCSCLLVGRAFAVFSLASTKCVITAPHSQRRTGQKPRPRRT